MLDYRAVVLPFFYAIAMAMAAFHSTKIDAIRVNQ